MLPTPNSSSGVYRIVMLATVALLFIGAGTVGASQPSDDAQSAIQLVPRPQADTQQVVLRVKGMTCESCERTVTIMLSRTPGVIRASVSYARREATVLYDASRTAPPALIEVVKRLGYSASVKPSAKVGA
ncbi:MAG: heavy-metal-associated domain-containing protein [Gemmatimonadaceae bacterium]